ncbi:MAG: tripartite tricarboxylate transporter permease [Thermoplasmata archaeon]
MGVCLGIITGLLPGIHVNTISFLLLSSQASIMGMVLGIAHFFSPTDNLLLAFVSMIIIGCSISHTFLNFIPSTYLGVPEGDTALSVLPAHRMTLSGRGYEAVKASAVGSLYAVFISLALIIPAMLVIGYLYDPIMTVFPYVLLGIVFMLIMSEGKNLQDIKPKLLGFGIFLLAGLFGVILLLSGNLYNLFWAPIRLTGVSPTSAMFFPLFSGLFGTSNLLISLMDSVQIPEQEVENVSILLPRKNTIRGSITGTLAGALVGVLPGVTAASATAITNVGLDDGEEGQREYIVSLSAVDTACALFTLVALFVIMKARSGAMNAVMQLNEGFLKPWGIWYNPPLLFVMLVFSVTLSAVAAYILTIKLGKFFSTVHHKIDYTKLSVAIIVMIVVLTMLTTGPLGMAVLIIATCIGMIPPLIGSRRVHLMGCLILPIFIYYFELEWFIRTVLRL